MKPYYKVYISVVALLTVSGLTGCAASTPSLVPTATAPITNTPISITNTLVPSLIPVFPSSTPMPTVLPYPTANRINTNAIAYVAVDLKNDSPSSLWVVNVDGSGEKELVDNLDIEPRGNNAILRWSPDGKWISYLSKDELWLVSPDGLSRRKILSLSEENSLIYAYKWSSDSSRIAYLKASKESYSAPTVVGIIDVDSGNVINSFNFTFGITNLFDWLPNEQSLLLGGTSSLVLVDAKTGKIIKEFQRDCSNSYSDRAIMPPSGQWFALLSHGTGKAGLYFCIKGVDGTSRNTGTGSVSLPVWDSTGSVLYFSAINFIGQSDSNNYNGHLFRYDIKTQQLTHLLEMEKTKYQFIWSVALSPDGRTLATYSATSEHQVMFIFMNLDSLSTVKYTIDLPLPAVHYPDNEIAWSSDSTSIVFVSPPPSIFDLRGAFYRLDIHTGKTTVISTERWIRDWAVSPVFTGH